MQTFHHKNNRSNQQGSALVFALLIVALTAIIATALIQTSSFSVRRTGQLIDMDMNWQALLAAELVAQQMLSQADVGDLEAITSLDQDWARPWQLQLDEDAITVTGQIYDLQGRFNVNLLSPQSGGGSGIYTPALALTRLMILLEIPEPQALAQSLTYWVGINKSPVEQDYLALNPPYRVAHAPLVSISEMTLIQGFSCDVLVPLRPYISALPASANINVNTADAQVLAAVLDTPEPLVETLLSERETVAFSTTQEFISRAQSRGIPISDTSALQGLINVNSGYFLLETQINVQNNTMISYSFLRRLPSGEVQAYRRSRHVL